MKDSIAHIKEHKAAETANVEFVVEFVATSNTIKTIPVTKWLMPKRTAHGEQGHSCAIVSSSLPTTEGDDTHEGGDSEVVVMVDALNSGLESIELAAIRYIILSVRNGSPLIFFGRKNSSEPI